MYSSGVSRLLKQLIKQISRICFHLAKLKLGTHYMLPIPLSNSQQPHFYCFCEADHARYFRYVESYSICPSVATLSLHTLFIVPLDTLPMILLVNSHESSRSQFTYYHLRLSMALYSQWSTLPIHLIVYQSHLRVVYVLTPWYSTCVWRSVFSLAYIWELVRNAAYSWPRSQVNHMYTEVWEALF